MSSARSGLDWVWCQRAVARIRTWCRPSRRLATTGAASTLVDGTARQAALVPALEHHPSGVERFLVPASRTRRSDEAARSIPSTQAFRKPSNHSFRQNARQGRARPRAWRRERFDQIEPGRQVRAEHRVDRAQPGPDFRSSITRPNPTSLIRSARTAPGRSQRQRQLDRSLGIEIPSTVDPFRQRRSAVGRPVLHHPICTIAPSANAE